MRSALVLLAIAVAFFASAPAEAGLKACNKTNRNADVAIAQGVSYTSWQGTYDPSKVFIKKDITVQSRVSLSANSCKVLADTGVANQGDEKSPTFIWYVYARTQNGEWTSGGGGITDRTGTIWPPQLNLCVHPQIDNPVANGIKDDLSMTCDRHIYRRIGVFDGTNWYLELRP